MMLGVILIVGIAFIAWGQVRSSKKVSALSGDVSIANHNVKALSKGLESTNQKVSEIEQDIQNIRQDHLMQYKELNQIIKETLRDALSPIKETIKESTDRSEARLGRIEEIMMAQSQTPRKM